MKVPALLLIGLILLPGCQPEATDGGRQVLVDAQGPLTDTQLWKLARDSSELACSTMRESQSLLAGKTPAEQQQAIQELRARDPERWERAARFSRALAALQDTRLREELRSYAVSEQQKCAKALLTP